jgi:hypothetical protein
MVPLGNPTLFDYPFEEALMLTRQDYASGVA